MKGRSGLRGYVRRVYGGLFCLLPAFGLLAGWLADLVCLLPASGWLAD
ncbi:MAG TPA: hypothetical protein PK874_05110 [Desulfobacteraceae bacterium]|nr:hypothetical protein [Desulfobacteraceae bacterium]HPJ68100.1 hypothetical protein [Desulfobacteraceae bacterium]